MGILTLLVLFGLPIADSSYAVYRKDNPNPDIQVLIDRILSEEGQTIVEKSGYVPIKQSRYGSIT